MLVLAGDDRDSSTACAPQAWGRFLWEMLSGALNHPLRHLRGRRSAC
jgi:hypothetical protein